MKKISLLITLCICTFLVKAQIDPVQNSDSVFVPVQKNIIKLNVFALALKNISLQYERPVSRKVTVAGTLRFMPKSSLPFKSSFISLANDIDTERQLNSLKIGNFAFMPEARYYLGKKGAYRGFYLGLFAGIARYDADIIIQYDNSGTTDFIPMTGNITSYTGGLMIGAQFKLSNKLYLDWWILGPHYGASNGNLSGQKKMDAIDQQDLRNELDALDIPLTKFTYMVDGNGAKMDIKGPWGGIRSGLAIGFRF